MHDITKFRGGELDQDKGDWNQDALYFQIDEDEKFVGDSGYNGKPSKVVVTKDEHSSEFKEFLARSKNRHETFHWRLKSWYILGNCFRHGVSTEDRMRCHAIVANTIAGIVQYDYENGHPPFTVRRSKSVERHNEYFIALECHYTFSSANHECSLDVTELLYVILHYYYRILIYIVMYKDISLSIFSHSPI